MNEQKLCKDHINPWLNKQPDLWYIKLHGHAMQRAGAPDYLLCVSGVFGAVEVKHPDGSTEPTAIQERELKQIARAQGKIAVVRSLAEMQAFVEQLRSA